MQRRHFQKLYRKQIKRMALLGALTLSCLPASGQEPSATGPAFVVPAAELQLFDDAFRQGLSDRPLLALADPFSLHEAEPFQVSASDATASSKAAAPIAERIVEAEPIAASLIAQADAEAAAKAHAAAARAQAQVRAAAALAAAQAQRDAEAAQLIAARAVFAQVEQPPVAQEAAPRPIGVLRDPDAQADSTDEGLAEPVLDPEVDSATSDGAQSPIESYGEAPVDRTPQFLRSVSPLLSRGQWQFDYGLAYSLQEGHFPAIEGGNLVRADVRRRSLIVPLALRYGINRETQFFFNAPVGWADTELATILGDEDTSVGGFGDLDFGITRLLCQDARCGWSLVGTVRGTAPTGSRDSPLILDDTGIGNGVWRAGGDMLMIQNLDPIILFYGGGYTYSFEREFAGVDVRLGHQFLYNMGIGFAVNERVTLSTAFLGSYISETNFNGISVANTDQEPIQIRMAATIARCQKLVEPFVTFGLTDTAPSAQFGVIFTR